jgi:hypothetical protein
LLLRRTARRPQIFIIIINFFFFKFFLLIGSSTTVPEVRTAGLTPTSVDAGDWPISFRRHKHDERRENDTLTQEAW